MTQQNAINNCLDLINNTVSSVFTNQNDFKHYLDVVSNLPNLDYKNQIITYAQKPDCTVLAGFNAWVEKGFTVQTAQSPILLLLPCFNIISPSVPALDQDGNQILSDAGVRLQDQEAVYEFGYNPVYVFDISQTDQPFDKKDVEHDDYEKIIRDISGYTLRAAKEPELNRCDGSRLVKKDSEIIYHNSFDNNQRDEYLLKAYITYAIQDYPGDFIGHLKLAVWYTVLNYFGFSPKNLTFTPFLNIPDDYIIRTTLLHNIQYYTNKIIQDFCGYYLDFTETAIINQLMTDSDPTDLFLHFENVLRYIDDQSVRHTINTLRDKMLKSDKTYPQLLHKDRMDCKVFSYPPYPFYMATKNNKPLTGGPLYDHRKRNNDSMLRD